VPTASAANLDYVKQSGANEVIDYRKSRFEEVATDVDIILDTVGGETLDRSVAMLKPDAQLISIATESKDSEFFFYVEPNHEQLAEIARLIDAGNLRSVANTILPLEQARDAYAIKPERGKTVLTVVAEESG